MQLAQIQQELKQTVEQYGTYGDQSLEYYGLVIKDGKCRGSKLYRRASRQSDENSIVSRYRDLGFFRSVIDYAKIYDFSLRKDEKGTTFVRLVFAPFRDVLASKERFAQLISLCHLEKYAYYFQELTAYYHRSLFTGSSPLLKMGIEMSESGDVLEAKAYFALKSFDDRYDNIGKRHKYSGCRHLVDKSLSLLNMNDLSDKFSEVSAQMEREQYYPVFTGINFSSDYVEMKLYFETCFSGYAPEVILEHENRIAEMMLSDAGELKKMHENVISENTFLDCISFSVLRRNSEPVPDCVLWKPYYLILDEKLVSTRMLERPQYEENGLEDTDTEPYKSVLLVDENDAPTGFKEKLSAHINGDMHRAFSVFLHDGKGNMLIQQRAECKYHSPLLLTNACCSHPLTANIAEEAKVRLAEELSLYDIELTELFTFHYCADVGNGLTENETDHVLAGVCLQQPVIDRNEVKEQRMVPFDELLKDVKERPERYTVWFRLIIGRVIEVLREEICDGN